MFHVLNGRYPSQAMKGIFAIDDYRANPSPEMERVYSEQNKFSLWADCEIYLAEAQLELGLKRVTPAHVKALRAAKGSLDIARIKEVEKELKHDVMAFVTHYRELADAIIPGAGGIIHLGATSCYVTDNSELMQQRAALDVLVERMAGLVDVVYQHGKDDAFLHGLMYALGELKDRRACMVARGAKDTTGTQASYMQLFSDHKVVDVLDRIVAGKMGFSRTYPLTGQTYPRLADFLTLSTVGLAATAISPLVDACASYIRNDFSVGEDRSWAMLQEVEAVRKNNLALIRAKEVSSAEMASSQWLERTLDDSSHRRILMSDTFIALDDAVSTLMSYVSKGLSYPRDYGVPGPSTELTDAAAVLRSSAVNVIGRMHGFAMAFKDIPCMGFTHFQEAQPTTVGKRIGLWEQQYAMALAELGRASSVSLNYDVPKALFDRQMGAAALAFAIASAKKANDMRLLQHKKELAEPFSRKQKGSSAMPHKRNPMKQERVNGLARNAISAYASGDTAELFLTVDAILQLDLATYVHDTEKQKGFTLNETVVRRNLMNDLPYLAAAPVMVRETDRGGDRQELHETLRQCALAAWEDYKAGKGNTMFEQIAKAGIELDPEFKASLNDPNNYIGAAPRQVELFDERVIRPLLEQYAHLISDKESEVKV